MTGSIARRYRGLLAVLAFSLTLSACVNYKLGSVEGSGSQTLQQQLARLQTDKLPADAPRYIFVGLALNSRETVFDADVRLLDRRLAARLGPNYRSVLLSNQRLLEKGPDRDLPIASIDQIDEVMEFLNEHKRAGDRFILLLSSHGAPGWLELEQPSFYPNRRLLSSNKISAWVDQLAPNKTWLLLSACYSGSHLRSLYQDHLLTMTASSAERPSFGCANTETNTWFVHELALSMDSNQHQTLQELWQQTSKNIGQREASKKFLASEPQIRFGGDWKEGEHVLWTHF
jgi:hypothetical protein